MTVPLTALGWPVTPYDDARYAMRLGDLMLCCAHNLEAWAIERATRGPWCHVGLVAPWRDLDRLMVLESLEPHGCRTVPLSGRVAAYGGAVVIARHDGLARALEDPAAARRLTGAMVDRLGQPYGWHDIWRLVAWLATGRPLDPGAAAAPICSGYVAFGAGLEGVSFAHAGPVETPVDIAADPAVRPLWRLR